MSHAALLVAIDADKQVAGQAIEELVQYQMAPFDENGECFRDGSRWDWWIIGGRYSGQFCGADVIQVRDLDQARLKKYRAAQHKRTYTAAAANKEKGVEWCKMIYGFDPSKVTEQEYLEKVQWFPTTYAFLRNRHWHEPERMGWFGSPATTECELKNPDDPDVMANKRLHSDAETGAKVVVWNEPWEIWQEHFYKRFVEKLPINTTLVCVDYHV